MFSPRTMCVALCAAAAAGVCLAQTSVSFTPKTSTDAQTPANLYAVDLNGDGIEDIVGDDGLSAPGFNVSINNGDGTFKAPVHYSVPAKSAIGTEPIANGDFNGDGKVDVAVFLSGNNQVAVFLGNGDGTLQSPKISTLSLPSGWIFGSGGGTAADLNGDHKLDLAAWTYQPGPYSGEGVTALYVFEGDGAGGFSNPRLVFTGPRPSVDFQVYAGDFDADGKADLIATEYTLDSEGNEQNTHVHVCYGNNDLTFTNTIAYTQATGGLHVGTGDMNSDGLTDFFGMVYPTGGGQQIATFYASKSRTFTSYFDTISSTYEIGAGSDSSDRYIPQIVVADFNGDARMDLGAVAWSNANSNWYWVFLLATGNPGQYTEQEIAIPNSYVEESMPVVGLFGGRLKPDILLNHSPNWGSPPQDQPSYFLAEINSASSGYFGPCVYPRAEQGFNVCAAGTPLSGGRTLFDASADSFGQMRKIELWVDGTKVQEQNHAWSHHAHFKWIGTFAAGTHNATFYAADVDNRLQRHDFSFTVGGSTTCSAPSSPSVHVCSPVSGTTVSSPVQATATATITGTLARMEIWVDGVKKYSETTSLTESTSIALGSGKHRFDFYAVNTAGAKWETTVYATVP